MTYFSLFISLHYYLSSLKSRIFSLLDSSAGVLMYFMLIYVSCGDWKVIPRTQD